MKTYQSEEILQAEDLYELQDTFGCSASPFKYQLTKDEYGWAKFIHGKYSIADYVLDNTNEDTLVMTFECPMELGEVLDGDGMHPKAVMLSDDTALQKLFFWLANEVD